MTAVGTERSKFLAVGIRWGLGRSRACRETRAPLLALNGLPQCRVSNRLSAWNRSPDYILGDDGVEIFKQLTEGCIGLHRKHGPGEPPAVQEHLRGCHGDFTRMALSGLFTPHIQMLRSP
jgi:hypothetical protein